MAIVRKPFVHPIGMVESSHHSTNTTLHPTGNDSTIGMESRMFRIQQRVEYGNTNLAKIITTTTRSMVVLESIGKRWISTRGNERCDNCHPSNLALLSRHDSKPSIPWFDSLPPCRHDNPSRKTMYRCKYKCKCKYKYRCTQQIPSRICCSLGLPSLVHLFGCRSLFGSLVVTGQSRPNDHHV